MRPQEDIIPPEEGRDAGSWRTGNRKPDLFERLFKGMVIVAILLALIVPFTPLAGRLKQALKDVREPTYITKEVIRQVEVPAPPPPLPDKNIPRKEVDVAQLFNGLSINTNLVTSPGGFASLERLDPASYKVQFQVDIRVPKANQSVAELARINPQLPSVLPGLEGMLPTAKVSGFFHKLYENKTKNVGQNLTRLNKILDRHNFYDCETILELQHPTTGRKALLIQSEMDVVSDGSDGDRADKLADYISLSDYYQPFTSYAWNKTTKNKANGEYSVKGLSAEKNRQLKSTIDQLKLEINDLKTRSSLIADSDPFIVISLLFRSYEGTNPWTPQMGDYAAVVHENKIYPAICGDYGPSFKMGEASLFMAKALNPKAGPYNRPVSDLKVSYIVFPGTRVKPFGPPNLEDWKNKCISYLNELGGIGAAAQVHTWEDKFKPATPPPSPAAAEPKGN
jgi:hypothetical protein